MRKLAVVTDFDGTLMEHDVGVEVMNALGVVDNPKVDEAIARYRNKEIGSLEWIKIAYPLLEGKQEQVDQVLKRVHLRDGAVEFLRFCKEQGIPVTILSDGMLYYIEQLLTHNDIVVDQVISNPITYTMDGQFHFDVQNRNEACTWCGCCKAGVVRELKEQGWDIIYIGDGSSDYYGSSYADWVFARSSLARYLKEEGTGYYPFQTFHDVLEVMAPHIESFRQGTAELKLNKTNSFCKF
ncbi:2-hydroxy-3-keto-5-methylthiopentenyl-1-phosphate phosphatase [compost metagenome]